MKVHSQAWSAVAIVLVVLGSLVVPGSVGASDSEDLTSGVFPRNGHAAVKVDWSGVGEVRLMLNFSTSPGGTAHGVAFVQPDGTTTSVIARESGILGSDDCVIVEATLTGSAVRSCEPSMVQRLVFGDGSWGGLGIVVGEEFGDQPGVWTLITWRALREGWEAPASWSLTATPGQAELLGVATGDRAVYATARDLEGGEVAGVTFAGAYASANIGSGVSFRTEGALIASIKSDQLGSPVGMTLHGPLGSQACPCAFSSPLPSAQLPPGGYFVEASRAGAGQQHREASVIMVDVTLPP